VRDFLKYLFARLYGYNLGRRFRSSPKAACSDAAVQISAMAGGYFWVVYLLVTLPLQVSTRWFTQEKLVIVAVIYVLVSLRWLDREFGQYADNPEVANLYRSPIERKKTSIAYTLAGFLAILLMFLVGYLRTLVPR
jgi:hypothetical protein